MTEENLDLAHKKETWVLFTKLSQWTTVLVVILLILMAFFLL
jgi:hypothetical protein